MASWKARTQRFTSAPATLKAINQLAVQSTVLSKYKYKSPVAMFDASRPYLLFYAFVGSTRSRGLNR